MKTLLLALAATAGISAFTVHDSSAACSAWGGSATSPGQTFTCTCNAAKAQGSYRSSTATVPGDASAWISTGDNSSNQLQVVVRCYNDSGQFIRVYSPWGDDYAYKRCPASHPYPTRAACQIKA